MPHEKKIEFLRVKMPPQELEEVLKRFQESDDFSQFFESSQTNNSAPALQPQTTIMPLQQTVKPIHESIWKFGWLGIVGAGILGAIGSAMFMVNYN